MRFYMLFYMQFTHTRTERCNFFPPVLEVEYKLDNLFKRRIGVEKLNVLNKNYTNIFGENKTLLSSIKLVRIGAF